ncbi:MAG: TatD family deoxyribonuclease [Dehalococcoidia bacterium]|nr:MAG: TatD family deoxyribonuclease [Dehalococcoidia bacterium]
MMLFDTHAHVDQLPDLEAALEQARSVGVVGIIAVGTDMASNEKTLCIAETHRGFVYPAIGVHPSHLAGCDARTIDREVRFVADNLVSASAVGEVGLDYHKRTLAGVSRETQQAVFKDLLDLAASASRPVLVHSRYAWTDALRLVRESQVPSAVFHWFTGFSGVLRGIMDAGFYVSATPAAEYHEEHRRAVRFAPPGQLLLETDAPVWYGRNERFESCPADVARSLRAAAELRAESEETLAMTTTCAAKRLLGGTVSPAIEEVT